MRSERRGSCLQVAAAPGGAAAIRCATSTFALLVLAAGLQACSSGTGGSDVGEHSDAAPTARPQVLNGGTTDVFREGAEVLMTGKASEDENGPILGWKWEQIDGPPVALIELNAPGVSFTAPPVTAETELRFRLTVEDSTGNTSTATLPVTVVPARDGNKFLSLDIGSGLIFDSFKIVTALAGGADTGASDKPFVLSVRSYLIYPPRSSPTASCRFEPADFAGGIPQAVAGGCLVEPLADLTPTALPGGGTGLADHWPANVTAPVEDAASVIERWWNPRFSLDIPRLDVREFNQRFVDSRQRDRMLEPYRAAEARVVLDIQLTAAENQNQASLIVTDLTDGALSLPSLFQGPAADAEIIDNANAGQPTRVILPVDRLLAAIAGRESALTSAVYYRTVDPLSTRTTFNQWLEQAGFAINADGRLRPEAIAGTGEFAHGVYVNNFDLGFGRQMYTRTDPDGNVFSFVQNFSTLEGAIRQLDSFATVVMEYSPLLRHTDSTEKFVKFFTYIDDGSGDEPRVSSFDFDGRGERATPGNCTTCHGGARPPGVAELVFDSACGNRAEASCYAWPEVNRDGESIADGNLQSMFLPWDLDSLLFAETDPAITAAPIPFDGVSLSAELERDYGDFSRAAQLDQFKRLNQSAYDTFTDTERTAATRRLVEHWYGGVDQSGRLVGDFDGSAAIPGWQSNELVPNPDEPGMQIANPPDASSLYLDVYARHCRMCHSNFLDPALRFETYREFIEQAPLVTKLVFTAGTMPGARLTMDRFWAPFEGGMAPGELLGAHIGALTGEPGPKAPGSAGPAIAGLTPTARRGDTFYLSGADSALAESYDWDLTAPAGSAAVLVGAQGPYPMFRADVPGSYQIGLTLNAGSANEATIAAAVEVGNRDPIARDDLFSFDLSAVLSSGSVLGAADPDFDPDGDSLSVASVAGALPAHGTLALAANGSFAYRYTGSLVDPPAADGFDSAVADGYGGAATARVTILINAASPAERPSAPVSLSATDSSTANAGASLFRVTLSWNASADDIGVQGYNIYRNGALIESIADASPAGSRVDYVDTSVEPDARYAYQVTATDGANQSPLSEAALVRVVPSLRQNIQTGWGDDGTDTLWSVARCVGCHRGAPGGLTLRGPAAADVYAELTEDAGVESPRIDTATPVDSTLLCKPLIATHPRACAHGGGDFLVRSDPAYETLLRWIEHGAPNN